MALENLDINAANVTYDIRFNNPDPIDKIIAVLDKEIKRLERQIPKDVLNDENNTQLRIDKLTKTPSALHRHDILTQLAVQITSVKLDDQETKPKKLVAVQRLINKSLTENIALDKYQRGWATRLGMKLLNLLFGATIVFPAIKYGINQTFLFSHKGKSYDAVSQAKDIADSSLKRLNSGILAGFSGL